MRSQSSVRHNSFLWSLAPLRFVLYVKGKIPLMSVWQYPLMRVLHEFYHWRGAMWCRDKHCPVLTKREDLRSFIWPHSVHPLVAWTPAISGLPPRTLDLRARPSTSFRIYWTSATLTARRAVPVALQSNWAQLRRAGATLRDPDFADCRSHNAACSPCSVFSSSDG